MSLNLSNNQISFEIGSMIDIFIYRNYAVDFFMESWRVKNGAERAPHRSLLRAVGLHDEDFEKPFIGIANSYSEIVPGHIHLRKIVQHIKKGVSLPAVYHSSLTL